MKKKIIKLLSALFIGCTLFTIPANAGTWQRIDRNHGQDVDWYYIDDVDNGVYATGWRYIDGEWYYFDDNFETADGLQTINGQDYYFDIYTKAMAHDKYVKTYEYSAVLSYAESDGHINYDKFTYDDTINKSTWN